MIALERRTTIAFGELSEDRRLESNEISVWSRPLNEGRSLDLELDVLTSPQTLKELPSVVVRNDCTIRPERVDRSFTGQILWQSITV
ncbi:MAG: hypothetical protein V2A73_19180 [Pseudomonadota bacterium]